MSDYDQDLSAIFGPCARHSEFSVGQIVRYKADGRIKTGEISWITPADEQHPLEYWIGLECLYSTDLIEAVDEEEEAICPGCGHPKRLHPHQDPDLAGLACNSWYPREDEPDTVILVHCPYCRTTHSPEAVQYCKQRYGKQG